MTKSIDYYCDSKGAIDLIGERFGPQLQGLNRFEKAQLLSILGLTIQEHEEHALDGVSIDFTPREAEQATYPYEISEDVDFCVVALSEDAEIGRRDYLALCEALIAQLRN